MTHLKYSKTLNTNYIKRPHLEIFRKEPSGKFGPKLIPWCPFTSMLLYGSLHYVLIKLSAATLICRTKFIAFSPMVRAAGWPLDHHRRVASRGCRSDWCRPNPITGLVRAVSIIESLLLFYWSPPALGHNLYIRFDLYWFHHEFRVTEAARLKW